MRERTAKETLRALCELADSTIQQIFGDVMKVHESPEDGLALLALGGYGRRMLFPFSDLDILFLFENEKTEDGVPAIHFRICAHHVGFGISRQQRGPDD